METSISPGSPNLVRAQNSLLDLHRQLSRRIKGCDEQLWQIIYCLAMGKHVNLEGSHGTGKTLTMTSLRDCITGATANRIQFTPDLQASDIKGTVIFNDLNRDFEVRPGPLFANIILADEINRATPKTQAGLLEAMQELQVTIVGVVSETRRLPAPFFVMATQNPLDQEGTFPLPEAQWDRFGARILYPALRGADLVAVIEGTAEIPIQPVMDIHQLSEVRHLIEISVHAERRIAEYIAQIVLRTRPEENGDLKGVVRCGASPRAGQCILALARARAFTRGKSHVSPGDVKAVAAPCLNHRIILHSEAEMDNEGGQLVHEIIAKILNSVPVVSD